MYLRILCEQEASPAARRRARRTSRTATCLTPIDSRLTAGTNLCANALVATSLRVAVRHVSCATRSSALWGAAAATSVEWSDCPFIFVYEEIRKDAPTCSGGCCVASKIFM